VCYKLEPSHPCVKNMAPFLLPLLICLGLWSSVFLPAVCFFVFFGCSAIALAVSCSCARVWFCVWSLVLLVWVCQCEGNHGIFSTGNHGIFRKAEASIVVNLPGQPPVEFADYSGYVTVNKESDKALFYCFFEAAENASQKLLVLWLTGGHFVPQLAEVIFDRNTSTTKVGNAVMDDDRLLNGMTNYAWNHAVISDEDHLLNGMTDSA